MFPFQPIDLSKLSYATALDIVAPILPGGTILLGWLYSHEEVWNNLHDEKTLKITVAAFAIYIVGFVMVYLTAFELSGFALAVLVGDDDANEYDRKKIQALKEQQNYRYAVFLLLRAGPENSGIESVEWL